MSGKHDPDAPPMMAFRRMAATLISLSLAAIVAMLCPPHLANAQPTGKVYRIGFLGSGSAGPSAVLVDILRDGLRERGWVEGRNFHIHVRFAENRLDRLPALAAELVRLKVDAIVAIPAAAAVAAKQATATIPIVFTATSDPVALGLIASVARPGGNVTGLAGSVVDLYGKRLQLLKEAVPGIRRVAVLSNPGSSTQLISIENLKIAAQSLGLTLQLQDVRAPDNFEGVFATIARDRSDAIVVVADPLFGTHSKRLAELLARYRLPSIYAVRGEFEPGGGLIMYGSSGPHQARQAAAYVDKILKGAKPGELPVEQPNKIDLVINLKIAKALGLTIPREMLLRADQVIE